MKRLLLILLLVTMPLQVAWAAAPAQCGQAGQQTTRHPGQHGHQADSASTDAPDASADKGDEADCDLCRHVAASALPSAQPDLPLPKGTPHLRGDLRRYVSHIPDLIPPPDRPIRL